jgi:hypothetical protein
MTEQLDLTIVYEPGEPGWVIASIPEVAGVFSQGSMLTGADRSTRAATTHDGPARRASDHPPLTRVHHVIGQDT